MQVIEKPAFGEWYPFPDTCPKAPEDGGISHAFIVRAWHSVGGETIRYNDSDFWGLATEGQGPRWVCRGNDSVTHWMPMPDPPKDEQEAAHA